VRQRGKRTLFLKFEDGTGSRPVTVWAVVAAINSAVLCREAKIPKKYCVFM
jgi:hypothetical protein